MDSADAALSPAKLKYNPSSACTSISDAECLNLDVLVSGANYDIDFFIDVIGTYPLKAESSMISLSVRCDANS